MPRSSYEQMDGGGGGGGVPGGLGDGGDESPMSLDDYERPPLRHIDKYLKAELPCIKTTRYTMALMTCIGFIISFGMRCNLSFAKLSSKPVVRNKVSTEKGRMFESQGMGINHGKINREGIREGREGGTCYP